MTYINKRAKKVVFYGEWIIHHQLKQQVIGSTVVAGGTEEGVISPGWVKVMFKLNPQHKEAVARYEKGVRRGHFKAHTSWVKAIVYVRLLDSVLWKASAFREQSVIQSDQNTICNGTGRRWAWNDQAIGRALIVKLRNLDLVYSYLRAIKWSAKIRILFMACWTIIM